MDSTGRPSQSSCSCSLKNRPSNPAMAMGPRRKDTSKCISGAATQILMIPHASQNSLTRPKSIVHSTLPCIPVPGRKLSGLTCHHAQSSSCACVYSRNDLVGDEQDGPKREAAVTQVEQMLGLSAEKLAYYWYVTVALLPTLMSLFGIPTGRVLWCHL